MGTSTEKGSSTSDDDAPGRHLTEDIHEEILLRLPPKSVLRFRAVCKAWRRIADDPRFIAAHARRRPPRALLYAYEDAPRCENRPPGSGYDIALDVVPVSGGESDDDGRRRLVRYPKYWTAEPTHAGTTRRRGWHLMMSMHCLLLASCDGVLLFKKGPGFYLLCNPTTKQWVELPRLDDDLYYTFHNVEYAFYFHQPSGEYRLLCFGGIRPSSGRQAWCVLSSGSAEPRRAADTHLEDAGLGVPCLRWTESPPAALHGRLHWPPARQQDDDTLQRPTKMVTFDTTSETFRSMMGPPTTSTRLKLFVMDGTILVADFEKEEEHVDLWFLENYGGAEIWERRHRVPMPASTSLLPPSLLTVAALADDQGNIMLGSHCGLVVYNVRRKTVRTLNSVATPDNNVLMSRHVFRESLVQLPCLNAPANNADMPLIHFWN